MLSQLHPVIFYPNGGIGNQLFQYAAARTMADRFSTGVLADLWHYGKNIQVGPRPFLLNNIGLPLGVRIPRNPKSLQERLRRKVLLTTRPCVRDETPESVIKVLARPPILIGYFQSMRFVGSSLDSIRKQVKLETLVSREMRSFADLIDFSCTCFIQVRRRDYVGSDFFDVVDTKRYYPAAIETMKSLMPGTRLAVVSDDIEWCREHPQLWGEAEFVDCARTPIDDIYFMSRCKAGIIANSSYGWWGAALREQEGPVIAPALWFKGMPVHSMGLLLPDWRIA